MKALQVRGGVSNTHVIMIAMTAHMQSIHFMTSLSSCMQDVSQDEMDDPEICEELSTDVEILQHAAGLGAIGVVQCFLKAQGSQTPATLGELGTRTPLHAACMNGQVEVAKLLLEARVSPISSDGKGVQPLHLAAQGSVEAGNCRSNEGTVLVCCIAVHLL